jgi:hypothetical protein
LIGHHCYEVHGLRWRYQIVDGIAFRRSYGAKKRWHPNRQTCAKKAEHRGTGMRIVRKVKFVDSVIEGLRQGLIGYVRAVSLAMRDFTVNNAIS